MAIKLTGWSFHGMRMPYPEPVQWADHFEPALETLLLRLETADGLVGLGECPVRTFWVGYTTKTLAELLDKEILPRLKSLDLADTPAVGAVLRSYPEKARVVSLVDMAIWDIKAQQAGKPLWRALGGTEASQPLSTTITRDEPQIMAETAAAQIAEHGFEALKIKTGQGLERDNAALGAIRKAVGDKVRFFVDYNFHFDPKELKENAAMLAANDVELVEDPVELKPDASFKAIAEIFKMPILVDAACQNREDAERFLAAGAPAVSIKMAKSGLSEGLLIGDTVAKAGGKACIGISANSSIGAIASISLAGAVPPSTHGIPCEESFWPRLTVDYMKEPLKIEGGKLTLPDVKALDDLVDWKKVKALAI